MPSWRCSLRTTGPQISVTCHSLQLIVTYFLFSCPLLQRPTQSRAVWNPDNGCFPFWCSWELTVLYVHISWALRDHWQWRLSYYTGGLSEAQPSHLCYKCSRATPYHHTVQWFLLQFSSSLFPFPITSGYTKCPLSMNFRIMYSICYIKTGSNIFFCTMKVQLENKK